MADFLSGIYGQQQNNNLMGTGSIPQGINTDYLSSFSSGLGDTSSFVDTSLANNLSGNGQNQGGMFSNFFSNDQGGAGWGGAAIGATAGLANTFMGFQQLSEGKKQNAIAQNQWQQQFDIQKTEYDRRVSERADRIANADAAKARANQGG